jgi:hypothetical protein
MHCSKRRSQRKPNFFYPEQVGDPPLFSFECSKSASDFFVRCAVLVGWRRTLCAEEFARDVEGLAAHYNDLLAAQQLLRDRAGQTAEQMALRINNL